MTRNKKIKKYQNPPPKSTKPKGSVNLGRSTFIDEIIRKAQSQASIGPLTISIKSPTIIPHKAGSQSATYAEIHSQIGGSK